MIGATSGLGALFSRFFKDRPPAPGAGLETLTQSEEKFRLLVESVKDYAIFMLDPTGVITTWNLGAQRIKGYSASEILGKHFSVFYSPADRAAGKPENELKVAKEVGRFEEEAWRYRKDGTPLWANVVLTALWDAQGKLAGFAKVTRDLTERKEAEAERLRVTRSQAAVEEREKAAQRTAFLAEATTLLASSLDFRGTLKRLAELSVPSLGDWCTVTILGPNDIFERAAIVHRDPARIGLIEELAGYSTSSDGTAGVGQVIRTGRSVFVAQVSPEQLAAAARDERHLWVMRQLGCFSCMIVPIGARGKVHGAISYVSAEPERLFNTEELALAEELARRAGIAIDNALLYEEARKAIRTRDDFLSIASHELKTPLTSLKLQLQIARRNTRPEEGIAPSPAKLAKVLDVSCVQLNRLTALIDDLLDVSKIEAGKLSYQFERLNLTALVQEMLDRYSEHLSAAGCSVSMVPTAPVFVEGDRFRLEQVVLNLLSNAAKYGAGQPIEVAVNRSGDRALIVCRDHGLGIDAVYLDKVFERFERAISSNNISGLGLGLYITREIVRAHHGSVRVESQLGRGSTFTVELAALQDEE